MTIVDGAITADTGGATRADTQVRPYVVVAHIAVVYVVDAHDEMDVIGHTNECIASDFLEFVFQFRIPM